MDGLQRILTFPPACVQLPTFVSIRLTKQSEIDWIDRERGIH